MSHRGAEELSAAIDGFRSRARGSTGAGLLEILDALQGSLQPVADDDVRERVRRRLAVVSPRARPAQELLAERALEEVDRLQHLLLEDEYIPWGALGGATILLFAAVGVAAWRRRGRRSPRVTGIVTAGDGISIGS